MTKQTEGWLESASNLRREAERLKTYAPAESVAASQRSIELSVKSMFALLCVKFDKEHLIKQEDFKQLMQAFPEDMHYESRRLPRLLLLQHFWARFRSVAEYGFETLKVPQGELFETAEAELALKHAVECHEVASRLLHFIKYV